MFRTPLKLTTCERGRFQIYFPHVDNVYSHRSTHGFKLKPFVSHYWHCRLKGRPPGTPKSTDPTKKNRKRVPRERDLCDVKIKITEFRRGEMPPEIRQQMPIDPLMDNYDQESLVPPQFPWSESEPGQQAAARRPTFDPNQKWFSVQRINGVGANGKLEGEVAHHKHTLEDSDRIKKNSVIRHFMSNEPTVVKGAAKVSLRFIKLKNLPFVCA
jgi:glutathione S-transferase